MVYVYVFNVFDMYWVDFFVFALFTFQNAWIHIEHPVYCKTKMATNIP